MRIDSLPYIDSPFYSVALYFMEFVYDKIYSIIKPDLSLIYLIEKGGLRLQGDPLKTRRIISAKGLNRTGRTQDMHSSDSESTPSIFHMKNFS